MPSRLIIDGVLRPFVLQTIGILGFVALGIFWAYTDRIEATLIAVCTSFVTLGELGRAAKRYVRDVDTRKQEP